MSETPLDPVAIRESLAGLPGWSHEDNALVKTFTFGSFREAISFMVRVSFEADALDHHPTWTNTYGTVEIRLTTHDAGDRVTVRDIGLAGQIEEVNWV